MPKNLQPHDRLALTLIQRLPDSLEARKRDLQMIVDVLPRGSRARVAAKALLSHIIEHERMQMNFHLHEITQ